MRCALDYLTGASRPARLHEVTMALCSEILVQSGLQADDATARRSLQTALDSGRAAEVFMRMVVALGGPADLITNPDSHLAVATKTIAVPALRDGIVSAMDTRAIGMAVVGLGGGRLHAADAIDFAVGLTGFVELGAAVRAGDPLALVHAQNEDTAAFAVQAIQQAIIIGDTAPDLPPAIYEAVRS